MNDIRFLTTLAANPEMLDYTDLWHAATIRDTDEALNLLNSIQAGASC